MSFKIMEAVRKGKVKGGKAGDWPMWVEAVSYTHLSQAEPMIKPSRCAKSSLFGMIGTRLKYLRFDAEMSW